MHFLHFWRAFGEAARLLAALRGEAAQTGADRLAEEVEVLRDAAIRALEEGGDRKGFEEPSWPRPLLARSLCNRPPSTSPEKDRGRERERHTAASQA